MSGRGGIYEGPGGHREPRIDYTKRDAVSYVYTPYRETVYKISEALNEAGIQHEIHVRPGYANIWAHPDLHERVSEIARKIDEDYWNAI